LFGVKGLQNGKFRGYFYIFLKGLLHQFKTHETSANCRTSCPWCLTTCLERHPRTSVFWKTSLTLPKTYFWNRWR